MIQPPGVRRPATAQSPVRAAKPDRPVAGLRLWGVVALAGIACLSAACSSSTPTSSPVVSLTSARVSSPPAVNVGQGPVGMALDATTHTLYVANQTSNSVSVLNAGHCAAQAAAACAQGVGSITLGAGADPQGVAVNTATDTVYVADNGGDVAVINGATCNAQDQSGCTVPVARVADPHGPLVPAVNQSTDTVYVANYGLHVIGAGTTVSVINGATCNGSHTSVCSQTPPTVTVGEGPDGIAVDPTTDTVYTANAALGAPNPFGDTVSVINGATCDATQTSGCGQTPRTMTVGTGPNWITVDPHNHTAYTANVGGGDVSVLDIATCNAEVSSGCGQRPTEVPVGSAPWSLAIDQPLHTAYVINNRDETLSVINVATCNGTVHTSCGGHQLTTQVGAGPQAVVADPATGTVFVANSLTGTVSLVAAAGCSALGTSGCRTVPPGVTVGSSPDGLAVDGVTHSLYVANQGDNTVSVVGTARCNASNSSGCGDPVATVHVGDGPVGVVVDQATHTAYVVDNTGNTVSVINTATCNAGTTSGCGQKPTTVTTGDGPFGIALDPVTDTVYVTDIGSTDEGDTVSVIDGVTCNAQVQTGCGKAPATVTVGSGPFGIAVNTVTDTVYVANTGQLFTTADGNTVSVINGATCNAGQTSGCGQVPTTVTVGRAPFGVAIDQATNMVYVVNNQGGESDATLSAIDGARCDGTDVSGCVSAPPVALGPGRAPNGIAFDPVTRTLFTANFSNATMSAVNLANLPGKVPTQRFAVGSAPEALVLDSGDHTVYVSNSGNGTVSVVGQ